MPQNPGESGGTSVNEMDRLPLTQKGHRICQQCMLWKNGKYGEWEGVGWRTIERLDQLEGRMRVGWV